VLCVERCASLTHLDFAARDVSLVNPAGRSIRHRHPHRPHLHPTTATVTATTTASDTHTPHESHQTNERLRQALELIHGCPAHDCPGDHLSLQTPLLAIDSREGWRVTILLTHAP